MAADPHRTFLLRGGIVMALVLLVKPAGLFGTQK
jgi:hypothetical protein